MAAMMMQQQNQQQSNGANGNSMVPDPLEILPDVVMSYLNYANGLAQRKDLDVGIQGKAMLEMAQAIQFITPLLPSSHLMVNKAKALATQPSPQDLQMKQAEMQMKAQEHQQNLQMTAQKHQMDMAMQQHKLQVDQQKAEMDMAAQHAKNQMDIRQQEEKHQQNIVQQKQQGEIKAQQAKQAAQSKPTSKQGNNKA